MNDEFFDEAGESFPRPAGTAGRVDYLPPDELAELMEERGNPLVAGLRGDHPICHWHAAVFERLFARLVWRGCIVREVACVAAGDAVCRFEVRPPT